MSRSLEAESRASTNRLRFDRSCVKPVAGDSGDSAAARRPGPGRRRCLKGRSVAEHLDAAEHGGRISRRRRPIRITGIRLVVSGQASTKRTSSTVGGESVLARRIHAPQRPHKSNIALDSTHWRTDSLVNSPFRSSQHSVRFRSTDPEQSRSDPFAAISTINQQGRAPIFEAGWSFPDQSGRRSAVARNAIHPSTSRG